SRPVDQLHVVIEAGSTAAGSQYERGLRLEQTSKRLGLPLPKFTLPVAGKNLGNLHFIFLLNLMIKVQIGKPQLQGQLTSKSTFPRTRQTYQYDFQLLTHRNKSMTSLTSGVLL